MNSFLIAPSLLSADFANLEIEIRDVERAGADFIHVDVMDGHFVPNITIGAPVVQSIKRVATKPLDVHLMIENPESHIDAFARAGADLLTIHVESTPDPRSLLKRIRELGVKPGITLRPASPIDMVIPFLDEVDLVLVMTVNPGFGGQSFIPEQVDKLLRLRAEVNKKNRPILIEVDGGINLETARKCLAADILVAGSFVFSRDYGDAIRSLKALRSTSL